MATYDPGSTPDWNEINERAREPDISEGREPDISEGREPDISEGREPDISEEEAEGRRMIERLGEQREALERVREANPEERTVREHESEIRLREVERSLREQAATVGTTTWNDNTTTRTPFVGVDPPIYTYTEPQSELEGIKQAVREVMKEMLAEHDDFMGWLRMKYTALEVQKPKKKKRGRAAGRPLSERTTNAVHTRRTSEELGAVRGLGAGISVGTTSTAGGSATSSVRLTERSPDELDSPPDQGGGERGDH